MVPLKQKNLISKMTKLSLSIATACFVSADTLAWTNSQLQSAIDSGVNYIGGEQHLSDGSWGNE